MSKMQHKLRHIAIAVPDVAQAQKFFEDAFGMTRAGTTQKGNIYMTDGTMNVALLQAESGKGPVAGKDPYYGLLHFGMWVDDLAQAEAQVIQAGAVHYQGRPANTPVNGSYEVKYRDPNGIVFDLTEGGWLGAVKNVKPAD